MADTPQPDLSTPAEPWPVQRCSYPDCGAAIVWVVMATTGKIGPVNADIDGRFGTLELAPRKGMAPLARFVRPGDRPGKTLYLSHFATCPHADQARQVAAHGRGPTHRARD